jgi:hypothetical protein
LDQQPVAPGHREVNALGDVEAPGLLAVIAARRPRPRRTISRSGWTSSTSADCPAWKALVDL